MFSVCVNHPLESFYDRLLYYYQCCYCCCCYTEHCSFKSPISVNRIYDDGISRMRVDSTIYVWGLLFSLNLHNILIKHKYGNINANNHIPKQNWYNLPANMLNFNRVPIFQYFISLKLNPKDHQSTTLHFVINIQVLSWGSLFYVRSRNRIQFSILLLIFYSF